jgi:hypothetical protein
MDMNGIHIAEGRMELEGYWTLAEIPPSTAAGVVRPDQEETFAGSISGRLVGGYWADLNDGRDVCFDTIAEAFRFIVTEDMKS